MTWHAIRLSASIASFACDLAGWSVCRYEALRPAAGGVAATTNADTRGELRSGPYNVHDEIPYVLGLCPRGRDL